MANPEIIIVCDAAARVLPALEVCQCQILVVECSRALASPALADEIGRATGRTVICTDLRTLTDREVADASVSACKLAREPTSVAVLRCTPAQLLFVQEACLDASPQPVSRPASVRLVHLSAIMTWYAPRVRDRARRAWRGLRRLSAVLEGGRGRGSSP